MIRYIVTFTFLLSWYPADAVDPKIDVLILNGEVNATIRGYKHPYGNSFRGIRYAYPPTSGFRFRDAELFIPNGLIEALGYGSKCTQGDGKSSSEDCLFLNIFSPNNVTINSNLPVYFYIHGGGFVDGSGNMGADIYPNLLNKGNIILVTINYRLGPFGFFSTRDAIAPGNFAVSDWIVSLNWVKRYIQYFGGDPNKVTIGGQSSGAEAVSILSLTPKATGLYKNLVLESGSAFGAAVMSYSEETRNTSEEIAVKLGCASKDQWQDGQHFGMIINCLRMTTKEKIVAADASLQHHRMKWSIVKDHKYLTERLEYMAMKREPGQNVLIGDVNHEWLGWEKNNVINHLNSSHNTKSAVKTDLTNSYEMTYWNNKAAVLIAAKNKYINNQAWDDNDHVNWEARRIQLWSEMVFIGPVLRDAGYFMNTMSNVYLYSFDWLSPNAFPQITNPSLRGCPHSWELQYIFNQHCKGFECTADDNRLREYFTTMWINFIKTGNPTNGTNLHFQWSPMDKSMRYLSITPEPTMKQEYHPDSMFWACTAPTLDGFKPPFC